MATDEKEIKEMEQKLDALLKSIEAGNRDMAKTAASLEQLESNIDVWEKEAQATDAQLDKAGNAAADDLENFATMIQSQLEAVTDTD